MKRGWHRVTLSLLSLLLLQSVPRELILWGQCVEESASATGQGCQVELQLGSPAQASAKAAGQNQQNATENHQVAGPYYERVIVTGTYEQIPLQEAERAVSAYDVRGTELLAQTWLDLLMLDASVDIRQRAPAGVQPDVSIRGGTFGQTLVLLDGLRMNDVQSGHHNMNLPLPLEAVERIEVLRGSGSTFYGSDAVGGVINIIPAPPQFSQFKLRGGIGNYGINQQLSSLSYATRHWLQQFAFSRDFSSGFMPNRDYRNLSVSSLSDFNSRLGNTRLILAYGDKPFGADRFYGNFNSWERTKAWVGGLKHAFSERTQLDFGYRRHTDLFVLYRDRPWVYTNHHKTWNYQLALRRNQQLGTNTRVYYGMEGLRESIESSRLGIHSRSRLAAYVSLDGRSLGRFSYTLGLREEVYGTFDHVLAPMAAVGLWASSRVKLFGSMSRAFRLPSYTDLYYHDPANQGSPDLRPESAWSYEGGLRWNTRDNFRLSVVVFHRREKDGIDWVRLRPDDIWRSMNINRLHFTGVEVEGRFWIRPDQVVALAYTGLHGVKESLGGMVSRYAFNYPPHRGVVSWQGRLPFAGLSARTRINVLQRYSRDPYTLVDLYVARVQGRIKPYFSITNALDTRYEEILGVVMPGRTVMGGLEVEIFGGR